MRIEVVGKVKKVEKWIKLEKVKPNATWDVGKIEPSQRKALSQLFSFSSIY